MLRLLMFSAIVAVISSLSSMEPSYYFVGCMVPSEVSIVINAIIFITWFIYTNSRLRKCDNNINNGQLGLSLKLVAFYLLVKFIFYITFIEFVDLPFAPIFCW